MATPIQDLPNDEHVLLLHLRARAYKMSRARVARVIAEELAPWGRWSWRKVMHVKKRLVEVYGYKIGGWKGGAGYPPGLFLPASEEEWRRYLGMLGRTINSHAQLHREFKRTVIRETSGQVVMW